MTLQSRVLTQGSTSVPLINDSLLEGKNCQGLSDKVIASKTPCWTCRRSRVICDKAIPTCVKCRHLGRQCLGYKKPLVWNKGVASRGKLMGKSFTEVYPQNVIASSRVSPVQVSQVPEFSFSLNLGCPKLVDPIFQGFDISTRYYLDYYARKLCLETVLHDDLPGGNPFRALLALIKTSPLILKTILAVASRHATNKEFYPTILPHSGKLVSREPPAFSVLAHNSSYQALRYKQAALIQLQHDLKDLKANEHDAIIASISIFIFLELLESGRDTWKIHLDGLKKLVLDEPQAGAPKASELGLQAVARTYKLVDPYLFDTCIICDIMGTTLATPYRITEPMKPTVRLLQCLNRSEKLSFIGCPAELLYLVMVVNWQCWSDSQGTLSWHDTDFFNGAPNSTDSVPALIDRIRNFEPLAWAKKTSSANSLDLPQRLHIASAYKSAVLIYAMRVLHPTNLQISQTILASLASQIIADLVAIPPQDPFFKCILWPTFIAGAETREPALRSLVSDLFQNFWTGIRYGNVSDAAQVLDRIWSRVDTGEPWNGGWTNHLANEGADWLFI